MAPTKRCHYTTAFKRKVVLEAERTPNLKAQRGFGVNEKNAPRWWKQQNELFNCAAKRMAFAGRDKVLHHEVVKEVADFTQKQREDGMSVTL